MQSSYGLVEKQQMDIDFVGYDTYRAKASVNIAWYLLFTRYRKYAFCRVA